MLQKVIKKRGADLLPLLYYNEKELLVESLMIPFLPFNLQALHVSSDLEQYENRLGITKYHILIVNKNPV